MPCTLTDQYSMPAWLAGSGCFVFLSRDYVPHPKSVSWEQDFVNLDWPNIANRFRNMSVCTGFSQSNIGGMRFDDPMV